MIRILLLDEHTEERLAGISKHQERAEYLLRLLVHEGRQHMVDTTAAATAIADAATAIIAKLDELKNAPPPADTTPDADVQKLVDAVNTAVSELQAAIA